MNNIPLHDHHGDVDGGWSDISRTSDSHRPPHLNPTCPGHGGQDTNHCTCNDDDDGNIEAGDNAALYDAVFAPNGTFEDTEIGDLINGEQGDETISQYATPDTEVRRAIIGYAACSCNCNCSNCDCHMADSRSPSEDTWSMSPSPSSSRPGSPYGYDSMTVEVGSRASSVLSLIRAPTPPQAANLFRYMTGGFEDEVRNLVPVGFVRVPLWLTPTLELPLQASLSRHPPSYPYQTSFNDSDFEDDTI